MRSEGQKLGILATGMIGGVVAEELLYGKKIRNKLRKQEDEWKKMNEFYYLLLQWIQVHQEGRTLKDYFIKNKFKTVAIYGMKEIGEALLEELRDGEIVVKYGIDRDADNIYVGTEVYKPDEELEAVDVIVVTAIHYYDAIESDLKAKTTARIVSIEDVVWEA